MARRITIMLDDELLKKLRSKQAKQLQQSTTSVSLSSVLNEYLKKGLH